MPIGCGEGDVRLVGGRTLQEGRVEICKNNIWSTVCHGYWGVPDSMVVCRQLGYSVLGKLESNYCVCGVNKILSNHAGTVYRTFSYFGWGTGPIAMKNVACTGAEARLIDCPSSSPSGCSHGHDVGVHCLLRTGRFLGCFSM